MVLPVRIELTTSALPRMRSTTELRQHRQPAADAAVRTAALWANGRRSVNPPTDLLFRGATRRYGRAMSKSDDERARRLAEALRANLRRRKAQARGDEPISESALPPAPGERD